MLRQLRKTKDDSGVVLIFVTIVLMILAIVSMGIFSQSLSQSKSSRAQLDQIVAGQLAKGAFWQEHDKALINERQRPRLRHRRMVPRAHLLRHQTTTEVSH